MSNAQRQEFAKWCMLVIGVAIMIVQFYRYATNTLTYSKLEMVMNVISVAFMIYPRYILNLFQKLFNFNK